jgi:hypothetical protein
MHPVSFKIPALFSLLTLGVVTWTMLYRPTIKPPNLLPSKQAVLLFEFARTKEDIQALFVGQESQATAFINKTRYLTKLDFLFILFYTLLTVSFSWQAGQAAPSIWLRLALILSPLIGLLDVLENVQLLRILNTVQIDPQATFEPELARLSLFTWIKWETTSVVMLLISPFLWQGGFVSKGLVVLIGAVFITGIIGLVERLSPYTSSRYTLLFADLELYTFAFIALYILLKGILVRPVNWF